MRSNEPNPRTAVLTSELLEPQTERVFTPLKLHFTAATQQMDLANCRGRQSALSVIRAAAAASFRRAAAKNPNHHLSGDVIVITAEEPEPSGRPRLMGIRLVSCVTSSPSSIFPSFTGTERWEEAPGGGGRPVHERPGGGGGVFLPRGGGLLAELLKATGKTSLLKAVNRREASAALVLLQPAPLSGLTLLDPPLVPGQRARYRTRACGSSSLAVCLLHFLYCHCFLALAERFNVLSSVLFLLLIRPSGPDSPAPVCLAGGAVKILSSHWALDSRYLPQRGDLLWDGAGSTLAQPPAS